MKNIAIISPEFPPLTNWGGIATFNSNLELLLSKNQNVHVITYSDNNMLAADKQRRCTVHYVQFKTRFKFINFMYYKFPLGILRIFLELYFPKLLFTIDWNVFSFLFFIKLSKQIKFHRIHTPTYHCPALLISLIAKNTTIIQHLQGPQTLLNNYEPISSDNRIKSWLENIYLTKCSSKIVSCSKTLAKQIIQLFPSLKDRIIYIPNFIRFDRYKNTLPLNLNNIVFMGRKDYRKGVDILLDSFMKVAKINNQVRLYLVGKNGKGFSQNGKSIDFNNLLSEKMANVDKQIRDRIYIFPRIDDRATLINLLQMIKGIAVVPSRYEPFGFVTIEFLAMGYITIASDNGGGSEIIENGRNGFLAKTEVEAIVHLIKQVRSMPKKQLTGLQREAIKSVNLRYDISRVEQLYQEAF